MRKNRKKKREKDLQRILYLKEKEGSHFATIGRTYSCSQGIRFSLHSLLGFPPRYQVSLSFSVIHFFNFFPFGFCWLMFSPNRFPLIFAFFTLPFLKSVFFFFLRFFLLFELSDWMGVSGIRSSHRYGVLGVDYLGWNNNFFKDAYNT